MRFILSVLLLAVPLSYIALACGDKTNVEPVVTKGVEVVTPRLHLEVPCRPCRPLDICPKWPERCPKDMCPKDCPRDPKDCPKTPLYGPRVTNPDRVCVFPVYNYRCYTPGRPLLNILRGAGRVAAAPFVIGAKISHNRRVVDSCRCRTCR